MTRTAIGFLALVVSACAWGTPPNQYLLKSGVRARAVVTSLDQTGTYFNDQPECDIGLAVQPPDGEAFLTKVTRVVLLTQIPQFQPGAVLTVRYDTQHHDKAIIEALGYKEATMSEADAQKMAIEGSQLMEDLNQPGHGTSEDAIVLNWEPTGVDVNGDNPLAVITVKVIPKTGAPYNATIKGVFAKSGVHKYQAGKEVVVKVDPKDPQRVTIDEGKMANR